MTEPMSIGETLAANEKRIAELEAVCERVLKLIENHQAYDKNAVALLKKVLEETK